MRPPIVLGAGAEGWGAMGSWSPLELQKSRSSERVKLGRWRNAKVAGSLHGEGGVASQCTVGGLPDTDQLFAFAALAFCWVTQGLSQLEFSFWPRLKPLGD